MHYVIQPFLHFGYELPNRLFLRVPVDHCPALSIPVHGFGDTKLTAYGTVVEVKCETGYSLADGTTSMTVECVARDRWNATVRQCRGNS